MMKPIERVKMFIELKKHLAFLGMKSDGKSHFNIKNIIILFLLTYCFVAMSAYILFESKSLLDFGNTFYGVACMGLNIFTFPSNVQKRTKIFELFTRFEDLIEKRKFYPYMLFSDDFISVKILEFYRIFSTRKNV